MITEEVKAYALSLGLGKSVLSGGNPEKQELLSIKKSMKSLEKSLTLKTNAVIDLKEKLSNNRHELKRAVHRSQALERKLFRYRTNQDKKRQKAKEKLLELKDRTSQNNKLMRFLQRKTLRMVEVIAKLRSKLKERKRKR